MSGWGGGERVWQGAAIDEKLSQEETKESSKFIGLAKAQLVKKSISGIGVT